MNELELVSRIASGQSSKMIAADLGLAEVTVESYRVKILRKYNVINAPQLVAYFYETGKLRRQPKYCNPFKYEWIKTKTI